MIVDLGTVTIKIIFPAPVRAIELVKAIWTEFEASEVVNCFAAVKVVVVKALVEISSPDS